MNKKLNVLVACEESQAVTKEFRKLEHNAFSCDIEKESGGYPQWHIRDDVLKHLNDDWDMIIAFPPCTHLSVSGARHFKKKRGDGRQREAIEFFMKLYNANCNFVAVENPVNIISGKYIPKHFPDLAEKYNLPLKSTQKIQPWQFGHEAQKLTCLWLRGLPELLPTRIVSAGDFYVSPSGKKMPRWYSEASGNGKLRSKTFEGVAKAMAEQWSEFVLNKT